MKDANHEGAAIPAKRGREYIPVADASLGCAFGKFGYKIRGFALTCSTHPMMTQSLSRRGIAYAVAAYFIWGLAPLYFKQLAGVAAFEVLTHRIIWSCLLLLVLLFAYVGFAPLRQLLSQPRRIALLGISSVVIALNWVLFIWAIQNDHMLDASLGYYINPLVNVVLGMLFFQERLSRLQWLAVASAAVGVGVQLVAFGSIPWVALMLAMTFGIYGLIRKKVQVEGITGLWLETMLLFIPASLYLGSQMEQQLTPFMQDIPMTLWLLAAGLITTVPLLFFSNAAMLLPLSVLGFFQYIGPSLMFILAVTLYQEPLDSSKIITFLFIWGALGIFSYDAWRRQG